MSDQQLADTLLRYDPARGLFCGLIFVHGLKVNYPNMPAAYTTAKTVVRAHTQPPVFHEHRVVYSLVNREPIGRLRSVQNLAVGVWVWFGVTNRGNIPILQAHCIAHTQWLSPGFDPKKARGVGGFIRELVLKEVTITANPRTPTLKGVQY